MLQSTAWKIPLLSLEEWQQLLEKFIPMPVDLPSERVTKSTRMGVNRFAVIILLFFGSSRGCLRPLSLWQRSVPCPFDLTPFLDGTAISGARLFGGRRALIGLLRLCS